MRRKSHVRFGERPGKTDPRQPGHCVPGRLNHIVEWVNGGETNLNNLTLLCRYHHHNFATKGWTCQLNSDGLPEWQPPTWLDPEQKPILNTRIQLAHLAK